VSDTGHDRVLITDAEGRIEHELTGFLQPQGVRFDGPRLLVCDTVAGSLVAVDIESGARNVLTSGMHSPWDVVVAPDGSLVVAEAGLHRLLSVPRAGGQFTVLAGTRAEGLRDGPASAAHLAQPSGLAVLPDGAIAFADSEVSALRVLRNGVITTLVGKGLFDWGSANGAQSTARLQHPLGVAALPDGAIAVADTFNSLLRVWRDGALSTVPTNEQLDEPGGLDVVGDDAVIVADTNDHRIVRVQLSTGVVTPVHIGKDYAAAALRGGAGATLSVPVDLEGVHAHLDGSDGPPVRVNVAAEPPTLIASGVHSWALDTLPGVVDVVLGEPGDGVLVVDITAATCTDDVCTLVKGARRHPLEVT
jgi:sugar lactone lactonase YvrE